MGVWRQRETGQGETDVDRRRVLFLVNRTLIALAVAAVLGGLLFDQWRMVLRNAILL